MSTRPHRRAPLARRAATAAATVLAALAAAIGAALPVAPAAAATAAETPPGPGQGPPPLPVAAGGGGTVQLVARGIPTPTAFAFGAGTVFVAGAGSEAGQGPVGGVFALRRGEAVRVPDLPPAFGLAWRSGTLYVASGPRLLAYEGWDGSRFREQRTLYTGPAGFPGFNGIALGPDGRIYAGVSLTALGDHNRSFRPFAQSVVSLAAEGGDIRVVARGLRQPWQLAFAQGETSPYVTVLGQENLGPRQPPDYVIQARPGQSYGFARCNWSRPAACAGYARPLALLPAHSSPMGIGVDGGRVYLALFSGRGRGPEVVRTTLPGGRLTTVLRDYPAPVVALGIAGGWLYSGDLTGQVVRLRLPGPA